MGEQADDMMKDNEGINLFIRENLDKEVIDQVSHHEISRAPLKGPHSRRYLDSRVLIDPVPGDNVTN